MSNGGRNKIMNIVTNLAVISFLTLFFSYAIFHYWLVDCFKEETPPLLMIIYQVIKRNEIHSTNANLFHGRICLTKERVLS